MELYCHELSRILRSPRAFWALVASIVLLASAIVPDLHCVGSGSALFPGFALLQLVVGTALVVGFGGAAFAAERTRGTLELLAATPLARERIATAKVCAVFSFVALLIAALAPLALSIHLLGGVDFDTIVQAYAVTCGILAAASVAAVYHSLGARTTAGGMLATAVSLAISLVLVPSMGGLGAIVGFLAGGTSAWVAVWGVLSYLVLVISVYTGLLRGRSGEPDIGADVSDFHPGGPSRPALEAPAFTRLPPSPRGVEAGLRSLGRRGAPVLGHPVVYRELRTAHLAASWSLLAGIVSLCFLAGGEPRHVLERVTWVLVLGVPLSAGPRLARQLSVAERRAIRTTPLTGPEILWGHLLVTLLSVAPLYVVVPIGLQLLASPTTRPAPLGLDKLILTTLLAWLATLLAALVQRHAVVAVVGGWLLLFLLRASEASDGFMGAFIFLVGWIFTTAFASQMLVPRPKPDGPLPNFTTPR